jgi:hypothetical protein
MRQRAIRRTTLLGALFLLLLSADDASSQQEDPWHELRAEALGFSVELPGRPEFLSKTFSTILGTVKESAYCSNGPATRSWRTAVAKSSRPGACAPATIPAGS